MTCRKFCVALHCSKSGDPGRVRILIEYNAGEQIKTLHEYQRGLLPLDGHKR